MSVREPQVFVVDDDPAVRDSLAFLLRSDGFDVYTFGSPLSFLEHVSEKGPACVILDMRMPELDGLEVQRRLNTACAEIPVIFLTGHGTVPTSVQAFKGGAADFLLKPVDDEVLLAAVHRSLEEHATRLAARAQRDELAERYASLSPREREVFGMVIKGRTNPEIAAELGIAVKTVKVHRGQVMRKMGADSLAMLVLQAERGQLDSV